MSTDPEPASASRPSPEVIEAAAAAWLSLRDRGLNPAETAEFVRWLQQDPRHAAIFAELDATWKEFDRLAAVPVSDAPAPDGDLLAPRVRLRRHPALAWSTLGVAAAAALVLLALFHFRSPRHTAETAIGAFQKLDLPDGSVAQLNTDTALDTAFTARERRVRVVRGEVHFTVSKDAARPFIVTVGPVEVRAIGTAFNVRHGEASVEVLVTAGRVRLDEAAGGQSLLPASNPAPEPALLVAGERATVRMDSEGSAPAPRLATVEKVAAPEIQRTLAWQERRLEFDSVPLAAVVREFNRYNRTQLVIADPTLADKRFSGVFRADGYEALVGLLERDFGVTVARREGEIRLHVGN